MILSIAYKKELVPDDFEAVREVESEDEAREVFGDVLSELGEKAIRGGNLMTDDHRTRLATFDQNGRMYDDDMNPLV
jgi:hypothetical protein